MKLIIELHIDEPISNDIDELTDITTRAVSEALGEVDYVIHDIGLSFELQDE